MARNKRSTLTFPIITVLAIALFTLLMIVIGVRLDTKVTVPEPSSYEKARQEAAVAATRIDEAISRIPEAHTVTFHGEDWAQALGGVWYAWPQGAPEGYSNDAIDLRSQSHDAQALSQEMTAFAAMTASLLDVDSGAKSETESQQTLFAIATQARIAAHEVLPHSDVFAVCGTPDYTSIGKLIAESRDEGKSFIQHANVAIQHHDYALGRETFDARGDLTKAEDVLHDLVNSGLAAGARDDRVLDNTPIKNLDVNALMARELSTLATSKDLTSAELNSLSSAGCLLASYTDSVRAYSDLLTTSSTGS